MKVSKNSLALAAAFAGLVSGTAAYASQPAGSMDSRTISAAGQLADISAAKKEVETPACTGMTSGKGNGGGSKKEWGKNSCKGQGACATDGSKPKM